MNAYVAILEDDGRRVSAMRDTLRHELPACSPIFFERSADFITCFVATAGERY